MAEEESSYEATTVVQASSDVCLNRMEKDSLERIEKIKGNLGDNTNRIL